MTRTAFIMIAGKPNVGKSTLLNSLLGEKVAIVSRKPQTTRNRITGVLTQGGDQFVFTDTPGLHKPKTLLGEYMMKSASEAAAGSDIVLFVVEAGAELNANERNALSQYTAAGLKVILVINKTDRADKVRLAAQISELASVYDFHAVVPVSALTGDGVEAILSELRPLLTESVHFFPDDTLTDQPERVLAAEIIREKILRLMDKEVPHGIAVSVEKMRERENKEILDIDAVIYCERETHKGMVIGKNGSMLKKISTFARQDLERFFDIKVNLHTWVKVKEGWRNKEGLIRNFGLD